MKRDTSHHIISTSLKQLAASHSLRTVHDHEPASHYDYVHHTLLSVSEYLLVHFYWIQIRGGGRVQKLVVPIPLPSLPLPLEVGPLPFP